MKVLLVTALVTGGVAAHVRMLATGLAGSGHRVVVACPAATAHRIGPPEDVTYVPLPVGSRARPAQDRRAVAVLARTMAGADVVHAHGLRAGALAATARRASRARPRLVVTTHNAAPEGRAARAVYAVLEQIVAHGADLVLGVSPDLVDRARRAGARGAAPAVVPAATRAVPTPEERQDARARVRRGLGLDPGGGVRVLVTVGRLAAQKDQMTLVDAMEQVATTWRRSVDGPPPVLLVVGEGPDRPALEARAASTHERTDVRLVGHRDDVPDLLLAADVAISSARWEGQPVWLQEALQAGTPVVATDVGGTATVLGDAGVLVDAATGGRGGTAQRLAGAVSRVLRDEALRSDLGARALVRAAGLPTAEDALAAALAAYLDGPTSA
ncbi:glycosyltransferase family 4 protein [Ornithinimicrobium avium]|uniref:glycosyltransferase family 4 protein n=1 Tax=Ornithinimicrobium avium TaxID=2283195 RepID=UPI00192DED41|nr:glycosyltransferase family 4 protein [Ornithinimicrobium avium]